MERIELSEEQLRKIKQVELNILKIFDCVCRRLDIHYSLASGTLLGAVRHQGFIPWDDDIDVMLLREDYDKLLKEGSKYLPSQYFLQTYETEPSYPMNFAKIRDVETVFVECGVESLDMQHSIYIDIFPIDTISEFSTMRHLENMKLALINAIKFSCTRELSDRSSSRLRGAIRKCLYPVCKAIGTQRLNRNETRLRTRYTTQRTTMTFADRYSMPPHRLTNQMAMPISYFQEYSTLNFEGQAFQVIAAYDSYLKSMYGDYMKLPPKEQQRPHHECVRIQFQDEEEGAI